MPALITPRELGFAAAPLNGNSIGQNSTEYTRYGRPAVTNAAARTGIPCLPNTRGNARPKIIRTPIIIQSPVAMLFKSPLIQPDSVTAAP
jgi:hypothetical protein